MSDGAGCVMRAYDSWSWRYLGLQRPFPDPPTFDVLAIPLPLTHV
jgi:hypothetical protein